MNQKVRLHLIEVARKKGYIHYQELGNACGLGLNMSENPYDRLVIGEILGEISEYEVDNGRPILSSIVITKSGEEGDGFYKLCESLGLGDWKKLKRDGTFSAITMNNTTEFWKNDNNYLKYRKI